jgi:hypothetical protein
MFEKKPRKEYTASGYSCAVDGSKTYRGYIKNLA